jgi:formate dehydrogenase iron-sulfur subunit
MEISRRDFIKGTAGATGLILLSPPAAAMASDSQTRAGKAMLIDITKCVNCWWCYAACKEYNNLPETVKPDLNDPPALSPNVWTTLHPEQKAGGWVSRKKACNHCTEAACVEVCPTGALSYNHMGYVQYDKEKCSGCGYCAEYCPFEVPQMETNTVSGVAIMNKCTFCHDRVTNGEQPACAAACTTDAIKFGERNDLIAEARERINELQKTNSQASVYGIDELQGLHVMYVLDDTPETYGLPRDPQVPATTKVRDIFKWLGSGLAIAAVVGFGFNYLVTRLRMRSKTE